MARQIYDIVLNKPDDFVHYIAQDFLAKNGFVIKEKKGEQYWQDGIGYLTAPKCFKYSYCNGIIHIEAWLKNSFFPGVYIGELNLEGVFGYLMKKPYKDSIERLIELFLQPLPADMSAYSAPGMIPQPVMVLAYDTSKNAVWGLVFGIASILLCIMPYVGILLGVAGIVSSKKGSSSLKQKMASVGMVLSIIGIVVSVVMWIINIVYIAAN